MVILILGPPRRAARRRGAAGVPDRFLSESAALATLVDRSDVCVQRLLGGFRDLGYTEGHNLLLEQRSAEGRPERLRALAAELVRLGVNAIVTGSNEAAHAAKHASATVPIVMAASFSPVQGGLVTSLARPGGNLTGLTSSSTSISTGNGSSCSRRRCRPSPVSVSSTGIPPRRRGRASRSRSCSRSWSPPHSRCR